MDKRFIIIVVFVFVGLILPAGIVMACPGPAPVADLIANPAITFLGNSVELDGSGSYDPYGSIVKYEWDFTNNGSYDYYETSSYYPDGAFDGKTTNTYSSSDTYTAKLRVTDNDYLADDTTTVITIYANTTFDVSNNDTTMTFDRSGEITGLTYDGNNVIYSSPPTSRIGRLVLDDSTEMYPALVSSSGNDTYTLDYADGYSMILTIDDMSESYYFKIEDFNDPDDKLKEIELFRTYTTYDAIIPSKYTHSIYSDYNAPNLADSNDLFILALPLELETIIDELGSANYYKYVCQTHKKLGLTDDANNPYGEGVLIATRKGYYYDAFEELIDNNDFNLPQMEYDEEFFRSTAKSRRSYLFATFPKDNEELLLDLAKRGNFPLFITSVSSSVNYSRPSAYDTDAEFISAMNVFNDAGIDVGLHSIFNRILRADANFFDAVYQIEVGTLQSNITAANSIDIPINGLADIDEFTQDFLEAVSYPLIRIDDELIECTYNSGTPSITVTSTGRGYDSTTAVSHDAGKMVYVVPSPSKYGYIVDPGADELRSNFADMANAIGVQTFYFDGGVFPVPNNTGINYDVYNNIGVKNGMMPWIEVLDNFPVECPYVYLGGHCNYNWFFDGRGAMWDGVAFKSKEYNKYYRADIAKDHNRYGKCIPEFAWWLFHVSDFLRYDHDSITTDDIHYTMTKALANETSVGSLLVSDDYESHGRLEEHFDLIGMYHDLMAEDINSGIIPDDIEDYLDELDNEAELTKTGGWSFVEKSFHREYVDGLDVNDEYSFTVNNPFGSQKLKFEIRPRFDYLEDYNDASHTSFNIANGSCDANTDSVDNISYSSGVLSFTKTGSDLGYCKIGIPGSYDIEDKRGVGLSIDGDSNGKDSEIFVQLIGLLATRNFLFDIDFSDSQVLIAGDPVGDGVLSPYNDESVFPYYFDRPFNLWAPHGGFDYTLDANVSIHVFVEQAGDYELTFNSAKALQEKASAQLTNPSITIGSDTITFTETLAMDNTSAHIIEYDGYRGTYKVYGSRYNLIGEVELRSDIQLANGNNTITFGATSGASYLERADIRISMYDDVDNDGVPSDGLTTEDCNQNFVDDNCEYVYNPDQEISSTSSVGYACDCLVAYWKFDEISGTTATDSKGSNDGALTDFTDPDAVWSLGIMDGGISLNDQKDPSAYVVVSDDVSLDVNEISISAWIYTDSLSDQIILSKGSDPNSAVYSLILDDGKLSFNLKISGQEQKLTSTNSVETGIWIHVAATYDKSEMILYINGLEQTSKSVSGNIDTDSSSVYIGSSSSGLDMFSGLIDEVRIYSRAISTDEVENIFKWIAKEIFNQTKREYYVTIQDAIDDSSDGDVITIENGTYREAIDFSGKAITITSTNPDDWDVVAATIIDANGFTNGVEFESGEDGNSVLKGFTVMNATSAGVFIDDGSPVITQCILQGNDAGVDYRQNSVDTVISRCKIKDNTSYGIYGQKGNANIKNNLIYNNPRGMKTVSSASAVISNNTFVSNDVYGIEKSSQGQLTISNCIVWDCNDDLQRCSATYSCIQDGDSGTGNISSDPCFVDADNDDYSLATDSPCIDVGDSSGEYTGQKDINGSARVIDVAGVGDGVVDVDMGCYEMAPVVNETSGIGYEGIQEAVDDSLDGDVITIKSGTYQEAIDFDGKAITIQSYSLNPEDVTIDATGNNYGVVNFHSGEEESSVLNAVTVKNATQYNVFCSGSVSPTVTNCILEDAGSCGLYCVYGAEVTISDSIIRNNSGHGIYLSVDCNGTVDRCEIYGNGTEGVRSNSSSIDLLNSLIYENTYFGVWVFGDGTVDINNCTIVDNTSTGVDLYSGGSATITIINSIIWGHSDSLDGGSATYSCIEHVDDANGPGNITSNPCFVDADNDDYHLDSNSLCIDAGNNSAVGELYDIDGDDRIVDGDAVPGSVVDMGADEYQP